MQSCHRILMFQSSSYWRMAEKVVFRIDDGCTAVWRFNPHHTGEWLKSPTSEDGTYMPTGFQSSSYWRMAEKPLHFNGVSGRRQFQSSSYWRMAEKYVHNCVLGAIFVCFNPHHTGEWLKSAVPWCASPRKIWVSILIILANG